MSTGMRGGRPCGDAQVDESTAAPPPWRPPPRLPERYETERLRLRYWVAEDAPAMLAALAVDRASLSPWLPWARVDNRTVGECVYNIERFRRTREQAEAAPSDFAMGIFERTTGEVLGGTGFHRLEPGAHQAEIGYWMRADRRRQGLCAEAVAGLVSWAFTPQEEGGWGLRRLEIHCAGSNLASRAVPQKLGLRREIHQVDHRWVEGVGWDDTLGWGVVAGEWDVRARRLR